MQSDDASSTFLRIDEFNESTEQGHQPGSPEQIIPSDETWAADVEQLNNVENPPTEDTADTGPPAESRSPGRPSLRRDQWAPMPQHPPPPVPSEAAAEDGDSITDSLSLAQLRRIVNEMPRKEATPYAFEYQDTSSFEEEVEELFDYSAEDRACLNYACSSFDETWQTWRAARHREGTEHAAWTAADGPQKVAFLSQMKDDLIHAQNKSNNQSIIAALLYLALGTWKETANQRRDNPTDGTDKKRTSFSDPAYAKSRVQVADMKVNINLIAEHVGVDAIFATTRAVWNKLFHDDNMQRDSSETFAATMFYLPRSCLVLMSLLMDHARRQKADEGKHDIFNRCSEIAPAVLDYLTGLLAQLRWNESSMVPLLKVLSLFWKTMLVAFGDTQDAQKIRDTLNENVKPQHEESAPRITASPLDYHLFRQEITSKYPAFDPPNPIFPFEADTTSMMPPLLDHARAGTFNNNVGPANVNGGGSSILHQPVHIATPAPSPPPSPAGPGGKGIKKQNYQTNQLFPFLYPPLDDASNSIGGKGGTELQDLLVGRKWEGSDVPTSILEAADIFASRMQATHAMKQLWDERVRFIKYERGYLTSMADESKGLDNGKDDDKEAPSGEGQHESKDDPAFDKLDEGSRKRLAVVEEYYISQLSRLQSLVIVLLKVLLQTVTTLVTQPNAPNGLQTGFESPDQSTQDKPRVNGASSSEHMDQDIAGLENINTIRSQEIMGKSVSAILLLLLKWFKLSHILKFEYLTQLLLDSNYIQLILKLFTHQELERSVNVRCEKKSLNFFTWCRRSTSSASSSPHPNSAIEPTNTSVDDAIPPPIPRSETVQPVEAQPPPPEICDPPLTAAPAEVDELGYMTYSPPHAPITNYSWRTFFSSINHLRVLQKIVKAKPHRQLLMVQYKYSNILKKSLKVPQPDVRLYTLKIIKGQVPYCHRKWRQSNMRIITAIYLHCKPDLRDDWLAGLTMEEEMSEALPQEQALRSLTYWHNLTRHPGSVTDDPKKARGLLDEEQDFFVKELEAMDATAGDGGAEGEVDPLDSAADAGRWSDEEKDAFLARMREVQEQAAESAEKFGLW